MLFVRFESWPLVEKPDPKWRNKHLDWFRSKGLRHELVAPPGWLDGDPGIFAVYFDDRDDPRISEYSSEFENATGDSLAPDEYQMVIVLYDDWLKNFQERPSDEKP